MNECLRENAMIVNGNMNTLTKIRLVDIMVISLDTRTIDAVVVDTELLMVNKNEQELTSKSRLTHVLFLVVCV